MGSDVNWDKLELGQMLIWKRQNYTKDVSPNLRKEIMINKL